MVLSKAMQYVATCACQTGPTQPMHLNCLLVSHLCEIIPSVPVKHPCWEIADAEITEVTSAENTLLSDRVTAASSEWWEGRQGRDACVLIDGL